jgi:hypothetical protein
MTHVEVAITPRPSEQTGEFIMRVFNENLLESADPKMYIRIECHDGDTLQAFACIPVQQRRVDPYMVC